VNFDQSGEATMPGNIGTVAAFDAGSSCDRHAGSSLGRLHVKHWSWAAGLLLATAVLLLGGRESEQVARIEHFAGKIERAHALAPETKATVDRLVSRLAPARSNDSAQALRRDAAIERITAAVSAKEISSTGHAVQAAP